MIKEETRQYGGIPLLVKLLEHENSEIVRNACGCLKNLAYGRENDANKVATKLMLLTYPLHDFRKPSASAAEFERSATLPRERTTKT